MDLSRLPVHHGFRLRGEAVTRLETFVDAAFAFAVTLLVMAVIYRPLVIECVEPGSRPGDWSTFEPKGAWAEWEPMLVDAADVKLLVSFGPAVRHVFTG